MDPGARPRTHNPASLSLSPFDIATQVFSYVSDRADIASWRATCKTFARRGAPRLLNCDFYLELRHDNAQSLYRFLYADERRFELVRGHMTLAVGGMTTYLCAASSTASFDVARTSLAVRDFDATVWSEPLTGRAADAQRLRLPGDVLRASGRG
ncbi:hypothetical protein K466DRAFT_51080 [Polyporus arcularius HHB13444]|uniref:F-box domain-containing protein n=1 Tax=Polyporus arcularius HHB13444 TaxID=1314778 RepID=A0A5C3PJ92_9APHY|nr:hypothetical protein K466DRAFT_51080 [Polyporus arcularius HHB13444]